VGVLRGKDDGSDEVKQLAAAIDGAVRRPLRPYWRPLTEIYLCTSGLAKQY
jgi:hypothetical protein